MTEQELKGHLRDLKDKKITNKQFLMMMTKGNKLPSSEFEETSNLTWQQEQDMLAEGKIPPGMNITKEDIRKAKASTKLYEEGNIWEVILQENISPSDNLQLGKLVQGELQGEKKSNRKDYARLINERLKGKIRETSTPEPFVTPEGDQELYNNLRKKYREGKEYWGEQLLKKWHLEALEDLATVGIKSPEAARKRGAAHTPVEPIGLYATGKGHHKDILNLILGNNVNTISSLTEMKNFFTTSSPRMKEGGQPPLLTKIALDPNARVLNVSSPERWLGVLSEYAQKLKQDPEEGWKAAGEILEKAIQRYNEVGFRANLENIFIHVANEHPLGKEAKEVAYKSGQASVRLTEMLAENYDAVRFPDVVVPGNEHIPQVTLMNKGVATMKLGKAYMPLGLAFMAAAGLLPEQVNAAVYEGDRLKLDPVKAQNREKELKANFKLTKPVDDKNEMSKPFAYGWGAAFASHPKQGTAATASTLSGFIQGLLPLDIIPQVESTYEAMDNAVNKLAKAANLKPEDVKGIGTFGEAAGALVSLGKLFKFAEVGRSWAVSKSIPKALSQPTTWQGKVGKFSVDLGTKAAVAAALGIGYEAGKGEIKDVKQASKTGTLWAGMEAGMASIPYAVVGGIGVKRYLGDIASRAKVWDGITKAWEKGLEKVPMEWAFGGKYGSNLAQYLIPASSRMKKTPEGVQALDKIEELLSNRYLIKQVTEEQTAASAKKLNAIPSGQKLAYYLMQMDSSDANFWKVLDRIRTKYGDKAADTLLTERAASRSRWTATGKMAAQTPWFSKEVEGAKIWVPKPEARQLLKMGVEKHEPMEEGVWFTDTKTKSTHLIKGEESIANRVLKERAKQNKELPESKSFFTGYELDDNGKFVLNFLYRGKNSETIDNKQISNLRELTLFNRNYPAINADDLKASGSWKKSYRKEDVMLLKESTRIKHLDTYLPRIFTKRWEDLPSDMQMYYQEYKHSATMFGKREAANMLGASAARFLKKHNLPQDLVDALEPVTDLCVLDYHGLVGARTAVMTARTFDSLSSMPKVCMETEKYQALLKAKDPALNPQDWVQVPNDVNRYFKLAGKMLQRDTFMELESLVLPAADAQGMMHRALIKWKGFKTIWSPRVHVRNSISNIMLNATVGDHAMAPWGAGFTAYKDMAKVMHAPGSSENAALLKEMAENNLFIGSFRQSDLSTIAPALDAKVENVFDYLMKGYQHVESKLAKTYEAEEKWAKGAKYLYLTRTLGIEPKKAAREALNSTFNYSDLPLFVKAAKEKWWGAPFVTFTYKAIPAMMESAIKYPWRIGAIEGAIYSFNAMAANSLGMKKEEWEDLEKQLPTYMSEGHYAPLPGRDAKNRIRWFDTSYLLPWGLLYTLREQTQDTRGARIPGLGNVVLTNPLVATTSAIMTNKKWDGSPIVHSFDDWPVAMGRTLGYVWEQAVPSLMIGGADFKSIVDTIASPEAENSLTLGEQIAKQAGLGVRPMSEEQIRLRHAREVRAKAGEIRKELRGRMNKHPEDADKEMKKAQERLRKLLGEGKD